MVGERLTAEDQLILGELLHLLIGAIGGVMVWGMVADWMTRPLLIGTGIVAGVMLILAAVLEQQLLDRLQEADQCSCISCTGDGGD